MEHVLCDEREQHYDRDDKSSIKKYSEKITLTEDKFDNKQKNEHDVVETVKCMFQKYTHICEGSISIKDR